MNAHIKIDAQLLARLSQKSGQCLDLANVLLATDEMLESAQAGNWGRVAELEVTRRKRLSLCFSQPLIADNTQVFSEALAIMLHLNEELVSLLEAAKVSAAVRHKDDQFAHEAIGHYLDTKSESL